MIARLICLIRGHKGSWVKVWESPCWKSLVFGSSVVGDVNLTVCSRCGAIYHQPRK